MNTFSISKFLIAILFVSIGFSSCKKDCFPVKGKGGPVTQNYILPAFNSIRNSLSANIYLTQDSIASISVTGQSNILEILNLEVISNELRIGFDKNCGSIKHDDLEIYVHLPNLVSIDLSGSGNVKTMNEFQSNSFNMNISGSGNITAAVVSSSIINGNISGSGNIYLSGSTPIESFTVSGSGNIRSFALNSNNSSVNISGLGDVDVFVNEHLDARISGGGKIRYQGNATVSNSISGSGNVTHVQ
jgi:hypothetical protein